MPGPISPIKIFLEAEELLKLQKIKRSMKTAHAMVLRVTIILLIVTGMSVSQVSRKTNTTRNTVKKWVKRYKELGLDGLEDLPRKGCPPDFDPEVAIHIVKIACEMPEKFGRSLDKWDCAEIAKELIRTNVVESISTETITDHPFKGWFEKAPSRGMLLATPKGVILSQYFTCYP